MSRHDSVEIRPLRDSDLASVIAMVELLEELPRWPAEFFESLTDHRSPVKRIALVAFDPPSGELLGFIVASLIPLEAELENIVVAGSSRRRGIGRQLLFELVNKLKSAEIKDLHLEVRASNHAAIGLYNAFGFIESGRRPRYYSDPVEDAVLMILRPGEPGFAT
jgi:[ribosomal protein S18]-alanine N-acetyltransferase